MSMTEKLLNKIRQKLLLMIMTRKIFYMTKMLIMKKNEDETLSHDGEDDKTQQTQKLYVLHVMIETTTNKQTNKSENYMFCSTSVKKKLYKKIQTYYYKRKLKKEMPVRVLENRLCLFSRSLQNFLEKDCDMRISRYVTPVG